MMHGNTFSATKGTPPNSRSVRRRAATANLRYASCTAERPRKGRPSVDQKNMKKFENKKLRDRKFYL